MENKTLAKLYPHIMIIKGEYQGVVNNTKSIIIITGIIQTIKFPKSVADNLTEFGSKKRDGIPKNGLSFEILIR
jgi:hypothetical protein